MKDVKSIVVKLLTENRATVLIGAGFNFGLKNKEAKTILLGDKLKETIIKEYMNIDETSKDYERYISCNLKQICSSAEKKELSQGDFKTYLIDKFSGFLPDEVYKNFSQYDWNGIFSTNIDDIVERVYYSIHKNLLVQNSSNFAKKRKKYHDQVLYKLHGCINNPDGDFVFSSSEYLASTRNNIYDYRFLKFFTTIEESPLVLIGSNFDEDNIDFYLDHVSKKIGRSLKNRIIIVNPNISVPLEEKIEELNGIHLNMGTKEFLKFMEESNITYKGRNTKEKTLRYMGCLDYDMIKTNLVSKEKYRSRLWDGIPPSWEDIEYGFSFERNFTDIIDNKIKNKKSSQLWISLHGRHFIGLSTIFMNLFRNLSEKYNVILFNSWSNHSLKDIDNDKLQLIYGSDPIIIMLEDSSDFFLDIVKDIFEEFPEREIVVITTANDISYKSTRHYLLHKIAEEIEVSDKINSVDYPKILETLELKGISHSITDHNISKYKDIIELVYGITESSLIIGRYSKRIDEIKSLNINLYSFLVKLAIMYRMEISGYLKSFVKQSHPEIDIDLHDIDEIVSNENYEFRIRNLPLSESVLNIASKREIINSVTQFLKSVSGFLSENERSYWRVISYKILKVRNLRNILGLDIPEISEIIENIRDQYRELSYYWMQLGKLHQMNKDFTQAHIALKEASTISPYSYQVNHALASNYLLRAIDEETYSLANGYYDEGKKIFQELIENSPYQYNKSFSVHSYVNETLMYYKKFKIQPTQTELRYMIDLLIERYEKDLRDNKVTNLLRNIYTDISTGYYENFSLSGSDLYMYQTVKAAQV